MKKTPTLQPSTIFPLNRASRTRRASLGTFKVFLTASLMAIASSVYAGKMSVSDFTGWNTESLTAAIEKNLPADIVRGLSDGNHSLWIHEAHASFPSIGTICVTEAGVTGATAGNLNPRIPEWRFINITKNAETSLDSAKLDGCRSESLYAVLEELSKVSWKDLVAQADPKTVNGGGVRAKEAEKRGRYQYFSFTGDDEAKAVGSATSSAVEQTDFPDTFDYRHVAVTTVTAGVVVDGKAICYSISGLSMRPPKDRNARWPGYWRSYFGWEDVENGVNEKGAKQIACWVAARGSVTSLLNDRWDQTGILKNLSYTQEAGLKVVTHAWKPAQKKAAATSTSSQRNYTSCHNECVNGNCLRTFPDGRQERWQAPRVYNSLNDDWEWDTSSCGS